jgi:glycosyltransferase involved in cell wall biosynthesis
MDAHDVMSQRAREFDNENLGFISKVLRRQYIPRLESVACSLADGALAVSDKDKHLMRELTGIDSEKIFVVPNGASKISLDSLRPGETVRNELGLSESTTAVVFHGNYETGSHNLEAARIIQEDIAPRFANSSDTEFFIIGKGAPESSSENIRTVGFVDDLYSTLSAMDVAAVPLESGTATKLKMYDYMSVGLPIVATKKGTEGIDLEHEKDVLECETADEDFVTQLERLIEDRELREQLGASGRELIEERYNWDAIGMQLHQVYTDLASTDDE